MGVLDPVTSPLVQEYGKTADSTPLAPKPPAPPKPEKTAETPPAAPASPPPSPPASSGVQGAMQDIAQLEKYRQSVAPPKLEKPDKPKTATDDIQLWGALAIAFAAFASMRTRTPMTTALNAAAAALNGMKEGSKERVDQAYKEWEQNTKYAFETAAYEQHAYDELMNQISNRETLRFKAGEEEDKARFNQQIFGLKTQTEADKVAGQKATLDFKRENLEVKKEQGQQTFDLGSAKLSEKTANDAANIKLRTDIENDHVKQQEAVLKFRNLSLALHDPVMLKAFDDGMAEGGLEEALKRASGVSEQKRQMAEKVKETGKTITSGYLMQKNLELLEQDPKYQEKIANKDFMGALEMRAKVMAESNPKGWGSLANAQASPENIDRMVDAVGNYKLDMPGGYLARTAFGQQVRDGVLKKYPQWSEANYKAVNRINVDMASGPGGGRVASLTTLMGHLQTLEKLADSLPNDADSQMVNQVMIMAARQFGNPSVTNYETASHAVGEEFNKVLMGSGVGSEKDRTEAAQPLVTSNTKEQLKGNIDTVKELVRSRVITEMNRMAPWVPASKFIPPDVQKFWGIDPSGRAVGAAPTATPSDTGEGPQKVDLPSLGASVPTLQGATLKEIPVEQAKKDAPQGATDAVRMKDGTWAYKVNGKWFRANGSPVQ